MKKTSNQGLTCVLLFAVLLLGGGYLGRPWLQSYLWEQELDREIAQLKPQIEGFEAMQKQNQEMAAKIEFLENIFCEQDRLLEILSELTDMFPEGTYLNFLNAREGVLLLQGFSNSASQLLPLLSGSRYLQSPELQAPFTRDPITMKERFFIKARMEAKK